MRFTLIIFIILISSILILFSHPSPPHVPTSTPPPSLSATSTPTKINFRYRFSYDSVAVNQKYGSLRVKQIKPIRTDLPIGPENIAVTFSGQLILTGKFSSSKNAPLISDLICITDITPQTAIDIPSFIEKTASPWFCFDNQEKAQKLLGQIGSSGTAALVIDNYTAVLYAGAAHDWATLVSAKVI